jgi:hypothetical protein
MRELMPHQPSARFAQLLAHGRIHVPNKSKAGGKSKDCTNFTTFRAADGIPSGKNRLGMPYADQFSGFP